MPGLLGMRSGFAISSSHRLSEFVRFQLVLEHPIFHFPFSDLTSRACKPVRLVDSTISLPRHHRKAAKMLICPVPYHLFGRLEPWQSQSIWTSRSLNKGIVSVRNQAQDDAITTPTSTSNEYKTLAQPCTFTSEVKKSKFIAAATPVDDEAAALSFLSQVRDTSASHNCWAFKIGDRTRFSDDGEPGGTAGRPMLSAITSSGIDHVMVVVTRFFGGTKLGTGGLVRAYGKVTTDCLKDAETIIVKAKVSLKIRAPYDVLGVLYPLLQTHDVQKLDEIFDTEGEGGVTMDLMVDIENLRPLERDLELSTKGRVSVSDVVCCSSTRICSM